ncbi:M48 family metallopeptidase [Halobacteriovorax sp. DA5]|uniref:M48 family metallopeptidase n=1 Tax=Halobacteriovorax sp. DA5 TaxID=2067553 RepID=UPI000CD20A10|nr:SprT family zinc-dependent metalloprotease [Halobacteriovorax sp. DA5]POB13853.1 M48 family peptidase [Halobacteriovorax sp. DA5]
MEDFVSYGNRRIDFTIKRKNRKTLGISVLPTGHVEVDAPMDSEVEKIKEVILKKGKWIISQQRDFSQFPLQQPDRKVINGETVRYLGRQYRLKIIKSEENEVYLLDDKIIIETLEETNRELNRTLLLKWYRSQAKETFEGLFGKCLANSEKIGIDLQQSFNIRRMHKRWGSCSKDGGITLNLELVCSPVDCIEYVIFHELCHRHEGTHNQRFYDLLATVCPDYRDRKKKLEQCSEGLMGL